MRYPFPLLLLVGAQLACGHAAFADERETRLTVAPVGSVVFVDAFDTTSSAAAYGGDGEYHYGLAHGIEVGGGLRYQFRADFALDHATVGDVGGTSQFSLYANLHLAEAHAIVRFNFEHGPFGRWRPVADLRVGGALRLLAAPDLYYTPTMMSAGANPETQLDFLPFVGLGGGFAMRTTGDVQAALLFDYAASITFRAISARLQLSWFSY